MHPAIAQVTERIRERSRPSREAYLRRLDQALQRGRPRYGIACSNLAHAQAGCDLHDKTLLANSQQANIAIVSSYNDMLSAHQPYGEFPPRIKQAIRELGAVAQFDGGVPAMCAGVARGQPGMELSLFSRDVLAIATAVALSHNAFDGVLLLGICDKLVPGLLICALHFGHLPSLSVSTGPMT